MIHFGGVWANEYVLSVKTTYKGKIVADTVMLRTALDPVSDCGLIMKKGATYILYAHSAAPMTKYFTSRSNLPLMTSSSCSRTKLFSTREARRLRRLKQEAPNP
jgi:hypothetical protein